MDRSKPHGSSRSGKSKMNVPHHGGELYALGTKSSGSRDDKSKVMSSVKSVSERKRESVVPLGATAKKPKLGSAIGTVPRLSGDGSSSSSSVLEPWEQLAIESDPSDLVVLVLNAIEQQDSDTVVGLLCGAAKQLSTSRSKTDTILTLSLLYLAKLRPNMFCNETVTTALVSILKRDVNHSFKGRNNPVSHIMAANLLARGYHEKSDWPEVFLRIYIDDAANDRVWVDYEDCAPFVENISATFNTRMPPKSMLQPELNALTPTGREVLVIDDDSGDNSTHTDSHFRSGELAFDCTIRDRFPESTYLVEKIVLETIKEQFNRRQQQDCSTRNFLKFLSTTCGLVEVRAMAVSRLELWIHNGKLVKPAQELLTYICYNVTGQSIRDQEVLSNLVKMRLKTKPLINIYMNCLKEMINLQPDILYIALKLVVQNELSNARNPNNMGMLANMFQTKPEHSAEHLAEIYQEFLLQREDCLRTLRVFLRELVKMLRYDINLMHFCKAFLRKRPDLAPQIQQFEFKDRIFYSMVDLTCLCMFLTVSPQVKEANVRAGRDMKNSPVLIQYYAQMSEIQLDALSWMQETVPNVFKPQPQEYSQALHKILLLDAPEQYSKGDQWPPDPERALLLRLVSQTPIHQNSILRIILIGITKDIPFSVPDTIDVIEQVIRRAAGLRTIDYPSVDVNKLEIIDFLFSMAEYHHPENIQLPARYEPPKLAISAMYWKVWNVLLMLSAHNPTTFGSFCWEQYPMLRTLMEMCITNQFHDVKITEEELQVASLEKSQILEFETHLAAATSKVVITEQNSLLLSQLMLMDPLGVSRRPPNHVLDQLQQLNASHKLGHLLCRSRKPDLLLDIIQRHGTSQSMPWLADLVQNSEGEFNHLPVQCLCEFLLSNSANMNFDNNRDKELLMYLQNLLQDENCDKQTAYEVLEYFLRRLASTLKQARSLAIKGIKLLLGAYHKPEEEQDELSDWLLQYLPQIPHFIHARPLIIVQLRAACQIENNPDLVMIYIQFIAAHTLHDPVPDMLEHVMDMSQLIVERSTIFQQIIPIPSATPIAMDEPLHNNRLQTLNCLFVMFNNYLIKLREHRSPYEWTEYPDLLMVHFDDEVQLPIHLNIIHAFVILLTHSTVSLPNSIPILDYWFPPGGRVPQAFTIETNELVQLLPDWLKLKMIRSPVERLVEAAMYGLTPDQIVLFVQNFGTPISSMSKLLALLDHAVIEQFDAVKRAILNKTYLAQLIGIQQARGAKNGHITLQALDARSNNDKTMEVQKSQICVLDSVNVDQFQSILTVDEPSGGKYSKEIEDIIDMLFNYPTMNHVNRMRFRKLIEQFISGTCPKMKISKGGTSEGQQFPVREAFNCLNKIIDRLHGNYMFQNILQKPHVCTFFRALLSNLSKECNSFIIKVTEKIIQNLTMRQTVENAFLLQILLSKRKSFIESTPEGGQGSKFKRQDLLEVLLSARVTELEINGRKFVDDITNNKKAENLIDGIVSVLNTSVKLEIVKFEDKALVPYDKKGILIDWLAEVDSELITINKKQQMDLLFGKSSYEFRFYLLSLLCHQANWTTLYETIIFLLNEFRPDYDCVSVLNFIEALTQNPKLWQGRDKSTTKHEQSEYVINVNMQQIKVFAEYVLNESTNSQNEVDMEKLNSRVNLLLKIISEENFEIRDFIDFIMEYSCPEFLKLKCLQQLYLIIPSIKFINENLTDVYNMNANNLKSCKADKIINYIITTIASLQTQKDYQTLSNDAELSIRKLAASHPSLFLRQLSVLSSLLQGKGHMSLSILRAEYHLLRFHQVLAVLELLQPLVFEDVYKSGLHNAMDSYFTFLKCHSGKKDATAIMFRFVEFLQLYINQNPSSALPFIEQYIEVLQELAYKFPSYGPLHQLVQGLSLLKHKTSSSDVNSEESKQEFELEEQTSNQPMDVDEPSTSTGLTQMDVDSRGAASFALSGQLSKQFQFENNISHLINRIQNTEVEDSVLPVLQDIESMTFKQPELLSAAYERLLELIFSPSLQVRNVAHVLLVRYLKRKPGNRNTNKYFVNAYIQCLRDSDTAIANSALESLTDVVLCLQEYGSEILRTAFDLSIQSRLNAGAQIKKCLSTLKLQHAC